MLIARNEAKLEQLAADARERQVVEVRPAVLDLTVTDVCRSRGRGDRRARSRARHLQRGAANRTTEFLDDSFEDSLQQIKLACIGPVALARHFAPAMRERGRGGIVLVGSLACLAGLRCSPCTPR